MSNAYHIWCKVYAHWTFIFSQTSKMSSYLRLNSGISASMDTDNGIQLTRWTVYAYLWQPCIMFTTCVRLSFLWWYFANGFVKYLYCLSRLPPILCVYNISVLGMSSCTIVAMWLMRNPTILKLPHPVLPHHLRPPLEYGMISGINIAKHCAWHSMFGWTSFPRISEIPQIIHV